MTNQDVELAERVQKSYYDDDAKPDAGVAPGRNSTLSWDLRRGRGVAFVLGRPPATNLTPRGGQADRRLGAVADVYNVDLSKVDA